MTTLASGPWQQRDATTDQLAVLADCWAVPVEEVTQKDRLWTQSQGGDAPGPRVVQLASRTIVVLAPPGDVSLRWAPRMVGLRGLIELPRERVQLPVGVSLLGARDAAAIAGLRARTSASDLAAASPDIDEAKVAVGMHVDDRLVGMAAVVPTAAGPPEVSILVDPKYRRRGLAAALEMALIGAAGGGPDGGCNTAQCLQMCPRRPSPTGAVFTC